MKNRNLMLWAVLIFFPLLFLYSCSGEDNDDRVEVIGGTDQEPGENGGEDPDPDPDPDSENNGSSVFLLIDDESIDNGNEPNNFSDTDVNDQLAAIGYRAPLQYFENNIGREIDLFTGQVGDEGWFALTGIPSSWNSAGPTDSGARNFLEAGPGLGENEEDDLLDEVEDVIPLRASGLAMLTGHTIIAVVYDSDISINYDPIEGNLQGENLGLVAFEVLEVTSRSGGSDSDLPRVRILIKSVEEILEFRLHLFANPPIPASSSEPEDINPPSNIPGIEIVPAE